MKSGGSHLLGSVTILIVLIFGWELLSRIVTAKGSYGEPLVPGCGYLLGNSLLRMSDYWDGGFGIPAPSQGGPATYAAALLALGAASLVTFERVFSGIAFGTLSGIGLGLLVATSDVSRRLIAPTVHIVRMTPFLAMIPLFNLWGIARRPERAGRYRNLCAAIRLYRAGDDRGFTFHHLCRLKFRAFRSGDSTDHRLASSGRQETARVNFVISLHIEHLWT